MSGQALGSNVHMVTPYNVGVGVLSSMQYSNIILKQTQDGSKHIRVSYLKGIIGFDIPFVFGLYVFVVKISGRGLGSRV